GHLGPHLAITPRRPLRRSCAIAEHHRQLPPLGFYPRPSFPRWRGRVREEAAATRCGRRDQTWGAAHLAVQRRDGAQELATVPDEAHTEILEVVGGQLRQYRGVDRVVAKRRFVLL